MKVAFCFPGQGSLERGMGRDIAEAVPEAMRVFEAAGYAVCEPWGQFVGKDFSICMEKLRTAP